MELIINVIWAEENPRRPKVSPVGRITQHNVVPMGRDSQTDGRVETSEKRLLKYAQLTFLNLIQKFKGGKKTFITNDAGALM